MTCLDGATETNPASYYFNRDSGMKDFELTIVTICYCVLCVAIIVLNYLALRAFLTTFCLVRPHRALLGSLAFADLTAGWLSIPSFTYNMNHWPNTAFFIYEASDAIIGAASSLTVALLLLQALWLSLKLPRFEAVCEGRASHVTIATVWFLAAGVAAVNVASTTGVIAYRYFFYLVIGWLSVFGLVTLITCAIVMVTLKRHRNEGCLVEENKKTVTLIVIAVVFVCTWALPYTFITYNNLCRCCVPVPPLFFYIVRMLLYMKSFVTPILYVHRLPPFYKAIKRILTRDCFADVLDESEC